MELKRISQLELNKILKQHQKWLNSYYSKGYQADLSYTDLSGINLRDSNLQESNLHYTNLMGADLYRANLHHADLSGADLSGANLYGADLRDADLQGADLRGADLEGANLQETGLQGANLWSSDLHGAYLQEADLCGADLRNAELSYANLRGTNLWATDLDKANLDNAKIDDNTKGINNQCPKTGSFIGYKKACNQDRVSILLVTLEIPEDAKRSSSTGKKCRCSKAKVLSIEDIGYREPQDTAYGRYNTEFKYQTGKTVVPDEWDSQFWKECTHGIHFFMNKQDALDY